MLQHLARNILHLDGQAGAELVFLRKSRTFKIPPRFRPTLISPSVMPSDPCLQAGTGPINLEETSMLRKRVFVLAFVTMLVCFAALPAAQAVTKVGRYAYALENGRIAAYAFDPTSGRLRIIQSVAATAGGVTVASATVHPSNKFLYVPTGSNSIAGFRIGTTGLLTPLSGSPFPSAFPMQIILFTASGKFAYTDGFPNSDVETFSVNTTTGALTSLGTVVSGRDTSDEAIMPKGNFIYIPNNGDSTVSGFAVNPTTGALTAVPESPFAAVPVVPPSGFTPAENSYTARTLTARSRPTQSTLPLAA